MMRLYYALGVALSPVMVQIFRQYNRMFKTVRPRVLILTRDSNEVLLVRGWTGYQGWELPGGGKGRHESSEQAVIREAMEELGINLSINQLKSRGIVAVDGYKAPVFEVVVKERLPVVCQKWELSAAGWQSLSALPEQLGPVARRILENDVQNTRHLV